MISIGSIVLYKLTRQDKYQLDNIRYGAETTRRGSVLEGGELLPLIVTRIWADGNVNGQVILDGNFTLWVTSRAEGTKQGEWMERAVNT